MTFETALVTIIGSFLTAALTYLGLRRSVMAQEKQAQAQQAIDLIKEYKGIGEAYKDLNDYVHDGLSKQLLEITKSLDAEIKKREILEMKFDSETEQRKTLQSKLNSLGRQFDTLIETFARYTIWVKSGAQGEAPFIEPWILDKMQSIIAAEGEQNGRK